jgi:hypothetical protein
MDNLPPPNACDALLDNAPIISDISDTEKLTHEYPVQSELYGLAGKVAELATTDSEADPMAVYLSFLTGAAALIGNSSFIRIGETKHYPRIFTALVGNSSRARKGTSLKPVERIIRKGEEVYLSYNQDSSKLNFADGGLSSAEGLIYAVRDESEETDKKGEPLWQAVEDKRILVVEEELANVLKMSQRDGNTLSPLLRKAWDGGNLAPMTKSNQLKATGAHINLLSHITHFELKMMLSQSDMYNGLVNRFLWICARRPKKVPFPQPMDDSKVLQLATQLADVMQKAQSEQEITLDKDAITLWERVYPDISVDDTDLKAVLTARSEAYVMRLSLLFCLLDGQQVITPTHINAGIDVIKYSNQSVAYIFTTPCNEVEGDAKKLLTAIPAEGLTQTQVSKVFSGHKKRLELSALLDELQRMGKIKQEKLIGFKTILWKKI